MKLFTATSAIVFLCMTMVSVRLDAKLFVSGKEFAKEHEAREQAELKAVLLEREVYELKNQLKRLEKQKTSCEHKAAQLAQQHTQPEQPKCTQPCGKNGGCSKPLPVEPEEVKEQSLLEIACATVPFGIAVIAALLK